MFDSPTLLFVKSSYCHFYYCFVWHRVFMSVVLLIFLELMMFIFFVHNEIQG